MAREVYFKQPASTADVLRIQSHILQRVIDGNEQWLIHHVDATGDGHEWSMTVTLEPFFFHPSPYCTPAMLNRLYPVVGSKEVILQGFTQCPAEAAQQKS